ncbi:MAG: tyrosine-type recombinase/integrase [Chloroflexi bacterium]|nr:tyrosine-type recombinase/integrase [Chloroflexota bacterium]MBV9600181.1 tyrosine-type recombinase/integrase [Chloroflexota bacterium]
MDVTVVEPAPPSPAHGRRALLPGRLANADDELLDSPEDAAAYLGAFARFVQRNVASGDAADDTRATYAVHVATWLAWCRGVSLEVSRVTVEDVEDYREALIGAGCKPATVAIKLTLVRRFYDAAVRGGLRQDNPAAGVRAPKSKRAAEDFGYLSEAELALLLRAVPRRIDKHGQPLVQDLRDKAVLALLSLQVLRTVEIVRANVEDLQRRDEQWAFVVRGKGHDRLIYLRQDVAKALHAYLEARGAAVSVDALGLPLMTAVGNRAGGRRLSRRGVRKIVDSHLRRLDLKRPGLSNHALRHTGATLAYKYTHDLRAVQDLLGHADPRTTARYARVVDKALNNPAAAVPIRM